MVKRQRITIDDLALMVKGGFDHVDKRFDEVDKRFDGVDQRFEGIDKRFEGVDKRFGGIEQQLINIESDVSYLKTRVGEIGITLSHHDELLEEYSVEFRWIHKKIDEMMDPRSDKRMISYKEFSELESRVVALEKKVTARGR